MQEFLSTLSLRRATSPPDFRYLDNIISIHALLAESDQVKQTCRAKISISIHALLAESDVVHALKLANAMLFLSTLSLRRATNGHEQAPCRAAISIHALLAESDGKNWPKRSIHHKFLSTLSLRRATLLNRRRGAIHNAFLSTLSLRRATHLLII